MTTLVCSAKLTCIETRPSAHLPAAIVVATAGCTIATFVFAAIGAGAGNEEWVIIQFAPAGLLTGWWLTRRRPGLSLGWLMLVGALTVSVAGLAAAYAAAALERGWGGADWGLWVFSWLWFPHEPLLSVALLVFPDGRVRGRWHRTLIGMILAAMALAMVAAAIRAGTIVTTPDHLDGSVPGIVNPVGIALLRSFSDAIAIPLLVLAGVVGLIPVVWTAWWWRHSTDERRRQFRLITVVQLVGFLVPVAVFGLPGIGALVAIGYTLALQTLIAVAILRWRSYEVDVVVRRSVLAFALLLSGLTVYAVVVIALAVLLGQAGTVASAVGAAVAIFTFGPLSNRIRRLVNRLFYGHRDDPYRVMSTLGATLAAANDPTQGLAAVTSALTEQLRLPYAAVIDENHEVLATHGAPEPDDAPAHIALVHHGSPVGTLLVGHRRGTRALTDAEERLIADLAGQVGAAVAAHGLVNGLRAAQERLLVARHEERRRIQQDLHDGLGPQLTAVTLNLDAARNHLAGGDPHAVDPLLEATRRNVHEAISDVRRLVYSLGDPAVASLGLAAALADRIDALSRNSGLLIDLEVETLPTLTAAIEEAVFRVVTEAVTNVVRHSGARRCVMQLRLDGGELVAVVADDGFGIDSSTPAGVGRRSMQDRTAELAGTLSIERNESGGTTVLLRIPVEVTR